MCDSGMWKLMREMVRVFRFGLMAAGTKVTGRETRQMGEVGSSMLMVMFMKEIGSMIKQMAMVSILTWMGPNMKASGRKTNSMAKDKKPGLIQHFMMETT